MFILQSGGCKNIEECNGVEEDSKFNHLFNLHDIFKIGGQFQINIIGLLGHSAKQPLYEY